MERGFVSKVVFMRMPIGRALNNNVLSGPIPETMGKLTMLQNLWVVRGQQMIVHVPNEGGSRFSFPISCVEIDVIESGQNRNVLIKLEVKILTRVPIW